MNETEELKLYNFWKEKKKWFAATIVNKIMSGTIESVVNSFNNMPSRAPHQIEYIIDRLIRCDINEERFLTEDEAKYIAKEFLEFCFEYFWRIKAEINNGNGHKHLILKLRNELFIIVKIIRNSFGINGHVTRYLPVDCKSAVEIYAHNIKWWYLCIIYHVLDAGFNHEIDGRTPFVDNCYIKTGIKDLLIQACELKISWARKILDNMKSWKIKINHPKIRLVSIIQKLIDLYENKIELRIDSDFFVSVDEGMLTNILENFFMNTQAHAPSWTRVIVSFINNSIIYQEQWPKEGKRVPSSIIAKTFCNWEIKKSACLLK